MVHSLMKQIQVSQNILKILFKGSFKEGGGKAFWSQSQDGIDMARQMEMAQIICYGCRTLLMYTSGATSVRCSCCGTINIARPANQNAYLNCGQCHTTLIYPCGAPSVKCAICHFVTNAGTTRVPIPEAQRPNETIPMRPSTSAPPSEAQNMTVVVENPMSVNQSGKLVSNVVVGVTTGKK
ncbi:unnamed protein product [Musa acuminata subsp. burmannicoides]